MLVFDTPRLHLRPLGDGDEALYCHLYTDAGIMRHIGPPLSAEAARTAFQKVTRLMQQAQPTMRLWVLCERASREGIGILALIRHVNTGDSHDSGASHGTAEIGAMLLVEGQGRGLAVEAQAALLDWVFGAPGVGLVWSRNAPGNAAAVGVRLKLGFERVEAGPTDHHEVRWQMTRERWHALRDDVGDGLVLNGGSR